MATHAVQLHVELTIHEGKFDSFEAVAQEMVASTGEEPGALGYEWCLSADHKRCRIVEAYADANALMAHLNGPAVTQGVPKMLELSRLDRFEVYGDPGPQAAAMLAGFGAEIFESWCGFRR
jgi:quinol monooxygenase YgiN